MSTDRHRIQQLNDGLRQTLTGGRIVITPGVVALGGAAVDRIFNAIAAFNNFCQENDPHEERDFGSFVADGQTVFFKIDYYDKSMEMHSPDPTNPDVTERVMTIMLANEY